MDPYQTAPMEQSDLGLHCLTKRPLKHFSRRQKVLPTSLLTCNTDRLTFECEININLQ